MPETATSIVLVAGTMTFANEWYQTGKANFKVAVATMFAAAIFDGMSHLDDKAAVGLSVIVLIGAFTTKFGGKSPAETITQLFTQSTTKTKVPPRPTVISSGQTRPGGRVA